MLPSVLFRTVPTVTDEMTEAWWNASVALTPTWDHITYRDPIDPTQFPLTSPHWEACTSGAQKAGLIRLEALLNHGGVYLDSDVELWRSIDSLLPLKGFAAWEDQNTIPDAVLGFEKNHPILETMIAEAIDRLGDGAWESGPGVTTRNLQNRRDVLLLPPQSFFPYHWRRADKVRYDQRRPSGRIRLEALKASSPFAFGAHYWRHSWAGS